MMNQREREEALAHRYGRMEEKLEQSSKPLKDLDVGDNVQVQNRHGNEPLRWNRSGVVIEKLKHHQYTVRMDGSGRTTLRNRQHLRKITPRFENSRDQGMLPRDNAVDVKRSSRVRYPVEKYQAGC